MEALLVWDVFNNNSNNNKAVLHIMGFRVWDIIVILLGGIMAIHIVISRAIVKLIISNNLIMVVMWIRKLIVVIMVIVYFKIVVVRLEMGNSNSGAYGRSMIP